MANRNLADGILSILNSNSDDRIQINKLKALIKEESQKLSRSYGSKKSSGKVDDNTNISESPSTNDFFPSQQKLPDELQAYCDAPVLPMAKGEVKVQHDSVDDLSELSDDDPGIDQHQEGDCILKATETVPNEQQDRNCRGMKNDENRVEMHGTDEIQKGSLDVPLPSSMTVSCEKLDTNVDTSSDKEKLDVFSTSTPKSVNESPDGTEMWDDISSNVKNTTEQQPEPSKQIALDELSSLSHSTGELEAIENKTESVIETESSPSNASPDKTGASAVNSSGEPINDGEDQSKSFSENDPSSLNASPDKTGTSAINSSGEPINDGEEQSKSFNEYDPSSINASPDKTGTSAINSSGEPINDGEEQFESFNEYDQSSLNASPDKTGISAINSSGEAINDGEEHSESFNENDPSSLNASPDKTGTSAINSLGKKKKVPTATLR